MTTKRRQAAAVAILVLATFACAESTKHKTLRYTLTSLNAAREGFVAWDGHHQEDIVRAAPSLEEGKNKLTKYRQKRQRVIEAFTLAYAAVAAAALDSGYAQLFEAGRLAKELYDLIKNLQEGER